MFLVNSRQPHFTATLLSSRREVYHHKGHAFSRSYGIILQSSLTTINSSALGYSPYPPVSVWGTDAKYSPRETFLGSMGSTSNDASEDLSPHHTSVLRSPVFILGDPPTCFDRDVQNPAGVYTLLRPSSLQQIQGGTGILTCFPSTTPFGLALGSD